MPWVACRLRTMALVWLLTVGAGANASAADDLSCASFNSALWKAITVGGGRVTLPDFGAKIARNVGGYQFVVKNIADIEGILICRSNDALDRFTVMTEVRSGEEAVQVSRLMALASATICAAHREYRAAKCDAMALGLIDAVTADFERSYKRGDLKPDVRGRVQPLTGGYTLQFRAMSGLLSYSVLGRQAD